MSLSDQRWLTIRQTEYPWERDALDFMRQGLPDREPFFVWSLFEFLSPDGAISEVDALVLSPVGLFLVEIKSKPGLVEGNAQEWVWTSRRPDGKMKTELIDSPLLLANRKCKRLRSLLDQEFSQKKHAKLKCPFIEPLVFLSHPEVECKLTDADRSRICLRDRAESPNSKPRWGIISALTERKGLTRTSSSGNTAPPILHSNPERTFSTIDRPTAQLVIQAMQKIGIRPRPTKRIVGNYELRTLLSDNAELAYQDYLGQHVNLEREQALVRLYSLPASSRNTANGSEASTDAQRDAARREYELLTSLDHQAIVKVRDYTTSDFGHAVFFKYDPHYVTFSLRI